jgi:AcrR family transcriptional regulator
LANESTQIRSKSETTSSRADKRRPRRSRLEQSALIRDRLFSAAAEVVGKVGYADASIALITQKAGVAQGTFYNYFESRQDLLDRLLPALGDQMLAHVRKHALGGHNFAELEERSFQGFFSFLRETPAFLRILNEGESYAPVGYKRYFETLTKGYVKFLKRSLRNGEFPAYREDELEAIAFILISARSYIPMRYTGKSGKNGKGGELPMWVVKTYMKFVRYGLQGVPAAKSSGRPAADKKSARSG